MVFIRILFPILGVYLFLLTGCANNSPEIFTIEDSGAWCWFSDPRAIYIHGEDEGILTGWVTMDGSVESAIISLDGGSIRREILYPELEKDDHNSPAFLQLSSGGLMAFYTKHVDEFLYYHHGESRGEKIWSPVIEFDPIDSREFLKFPKRGVCYANPVQLYSEDGRIYLFGRWTGFKPNVSWSDDNGQSFSKSKVVIAEEGFRALNRPYVKYFSQGDSVIHMTFTDGHPRNEEANSVYYACYTNGGFHRADGTLICRLEELPFSPDRSMLVNEADSIKGRAWVHDIVADSDQNPVILYARYPSEKDHIYHHVRFEGTHWQDHEICHAGSWFPQTRKGSVEKEPHYSGGMTLNPMDPNIVYLSREVNGVFEIERWKINPRRAKWKSAPITEESRVDQVRPFIPRHMKESDPTTVIWMENNRYVHYTDYNSVIRYTIE